MSDALPTAVARPSRRLSWAWLLPLLALALGAWLLYSTWAAQGLLIRIRFDEGHGLEPGAALRYRGITVGEVRSIAVAQDGPGVIITAALAEESTAQLAREGARFWIVRPQLGLERVSGLETIISARYIAARPGEGPPQRTFEGLEQPPVVESLDEGDLEVVLEASARHGIARGAPVSYRGVRVGRVLSVGLTSDAGAVEARVHIDRPYVHLVHQHTCFWPSSGIEAEVGITGLNVQLESLTGLLTGGIAFATPPDGGEVVTTGHRFVMRAEPEEDWLEWEPSIVIGNELVEEPQSPLPNPLRARLRWREGRIGQFLPRDMSRSGWMLPTPRGLIAPENLIVPKRDDDDVTDVALEVAGVALRDVQPVELTRGMVLVPTEALPDEIDLEAMLMPTLRRPEAPTEALVVLDPGTPPIPVSVGRFTESGSGWRIDRAVDIPATWHGAPVIARRDGAVLGILLVPDDDDDPRRVALAPEDIVK